MLLVKPCMREPAKSAFNMRVSPPDLSSDTKKEQLMSYSFVVNYLLLTSESDDMVANAEVER